MCVIAGVHRATDGARNGIVGVLAVAGFGRCGWLCGCRATIIIIISHLVRCSSECHDWRNSIDLTRHTRQDTKMKSGQDDKIRWSTHATTTAAAISSSRHFVQGRTYISFNCNQQKNPNTHEQINTKQSTAAATEAASVHYYYYYCCIIGWFSAFLVSLQDARALHNLSIPFLFFFLSHAICHGYSFAGERIKSHRTNSQPKISRTMI